MYYPFLRGKQYELIMLREMAAKISKSGIVPIIEPVKKNFSSLRKTLDKLVENNCRFIIVSNPSVGELKENSAALFEEIIKNYPIRNNNLSIALILSPASSLEDAERFIRTGDGKISFIHSGFSEGSKLASLIAKLGAKIEEHIFADSEDNILYRRHFKTDKRILIKDGFRSQKNSEYPLSESFSELYLTYNELGMNGFGDYLIAGKEFREGGGPAYAIAIHLTYIEPEADGIICVKHFKSTRVNTPKDPAGKFLEALEKLIKDCNSNPNILNTEAVKEFRSLYERKHFPGLGYVKKLSMQHHIELISSLEN